MNNDDIYAPPKADITSSRQGVIITDFSKGIVFVPRGSDLPPRCVKCNAPARQPIKVRSLYWHSPWLYLLIFVYFLVYVLVALFVRKKFKLSVGLCEIHHQERRKKMAMWFGGFIFLIMLAFGSFLSGYTNVGLIAILLLFIVIILTARDLKLLSIVKIDNEGIYIKDLGKAFLQSLV